MSYYPNSSYVIFYDHDTPNTSKWSCSAIYALQSVDEAFLLRERNPITTHLKDVVKEIVFNDIKIVELNINFYIPKFGVPIKHVYEKDPSGAFFEDETFINMCLTLVNGEEIAFQIGKPSRTLPILLNIIEKYGIELETDKEILADMISMTTHDLYQKYIRANIDFEPFIVKENKNGW